MLPWCWRWRWSSPSWRLRTRNLPLVVEELLGTSNALTRGAWNSAYQPGDRGVSRGHPVWFGRAARYGNFHYPQVPGPGHKGDTQELS